MQLPGQILDGYVDSVGSPQECSGTFRRSAPEGGLVLLEC